ncbi:Hypothetical predicted protein [Mytilus galloprovincialis]|uniref:EF-hand domain-containing protein n=1 Tax=Mytilus galloprovincialis TaxID=29158 RepID=A0A8B6FT87_MYTGA|nr:Hypothetical predicted protein [Mytilus galloprovincialis]
MEGENTKDSNSEKYRKEIRKAWNVLDQNGDNQVNASEIVRGSRVLGMNPTLQEAEKWIADIDENKNGYIGYDEFETMMTQYYDVLDYQEQEIRKAFKRFDTDGTGFLDHTQLKRALKNIGDQLTEEECDEFFNLTDTNNDGKIDIEGTLVYEVTPYHRQCLLDMF